MSRRVNQARSDADPDSLGLASQACKRCYARKRKCDRRLPRCSLCVEADVPCEVELKGTEKTLHARLTESQKQVAALQDRVRWLESALSDRDATGGSQVGPIESTFGISPRSLTSPVSATRIVTSPSIDLTALIASDVVIGTQNSTFYHQNQAFLPITREQLPTKERALSLVHDYIAHFKQSHHVLDLEELKEDVEKVYAVDGLTSPSAAQSRFRCFGTLSGAMEEYSLPQEEEHRKVCREACLRELPSMFVKEDIAAIQALGLLAFFAIGQPGGPSLFQVVGLAARIAISLRLHRRDDVYFGLSSAYSDAAARRKHNEKRKSVFWAVYCLDRLTMHVLGLPPAMRDSDIDVDLPTIPPTVPGGVAVPSVALRIHNIKQRQLYGAIQDKFYAVHVKSADPRAAGETEVAGFVRDIQEWYDSSPLRSAFIPISPATTAKQCLDDLCYHQMMLAVHRPSPLIPDISSKFVKVLLNSSGVSVDLYQHYWKNKQILINWIHLYQIFISCITLVFCFCECQNRPELVAVPDEIVDVRLAQCKELLSEFGPLWPHSPDFQAMFDTLVTSFQAQRSNPPPTMPKTPAMSLGSVMDLVTPVEGNQPFADFFGPETASTPNEVMRGIWVAKGG